MKYILMMSLLILPVQAHADWSDAGAHPMMAPDLAPNAGQPIHHEATVHAVLPARVESQHRAQSSQHYATLPANHVQALRHEQPTNHNQAIKHDMPGYFRRDAEYYGYVEVPVPYADVNLPFAVPDGFETVMVNGETFYYDQGIFYQQVGNQLTVIPAVLGAVVDSIPEDYQIVMADGVHYLVTGGVYYQRVDQGFEVVQPPMPYQG